MLSRRLIFVVYSLLAVGLMACAASHCLIARQAAARSARRDAINATILPAFRVENKVLPDALAALSRETHAAIVIDPKAAANNVDFPVTQALFNVRLDQVLDTLENQSFDSDEVGWTWRGDAIVIGGDPSANLRVYDVRDLFTQIKADMARWPMPPTSSDQVGGLFGPENGNVNQWTEYQIVDALSSMIEMHISNNAWREQGGTAGSISVIDGRMFIVQSDAIHRKIAKLLADLRAKK